jgi:hypothetical protein
MQQQDQALLTHCLATVHDTELTAQLISVEDEGRDDLAHFQDQQITHLTRTEGIGDQLAVITNLGLQFDDGFPGRLSANQKLEHS